jgi:hypothetical protein
MWHGMVNLSMLSRDDLCILVLEPCLQDRPIALMENNFNLTGANIDSTKVCEDIYARIIKLGYKQFCHAIFTQLCPGYSNQPHAALEHIRQSAPGPDSQLVTSFVVKFYPRLMAAARPFQAQCIYPISICNRFIQKLDCRLLPLFRRLYPQHSAVHALDAAYQHQQLSIISAAAQAAENEVHQVQEIARGLINQGFFLAGHPIEEAVPAYPSQAEKTLAQYNPDSSNSNPDCKPLDCWGCGGNHS